MRWLLAFLCTGLLPVWSASAQSDAELASAIVARAEEAYGLGEFERAAVLLEESLAIYEAPAVVYNLARTLSELSRWEDARARYQRFLELAPNAPQRATVEARIAELDRRIARDRADAQGPVEPEVEPEPEPAPEDPAAPAPLNAPPFVLLGLGVVTTALAIPLGLASSSAKDRAGQADTHREGASELDTARRYARGANAVAAIGGVLTVGAIVWAIVRPRREASGSVSFDGARLRVAF
ncbi:MAG: tetratricopeptide repeat protein [Myxococcota bacterium]